MIRSDVHEAANALLWNGLNADPELCTQTQRILEEEGELSPSFLGFVGIYYHLSLIVPYDRTVYDLGCCNGFQAWFFRDHHRYVGIDSWPGITFLHTQNSEHHNVSIKEFIDTVTIDDSHFAICSYVPPWHGGSVELVRATFKHMFTFYPCSRDRGAFSPVRPKQPESVLREA